MRNSSPFRRTGPEPSERFRIRVRLFATLITLLFFGLMFRLWQLQVVQGNKFRRLSETNRIAYRLVRSPRGLIYDRRGKILADNRPSFNIYLIKEDAIDLKTSVRKLARMTRQEYPALWRRVRNASSFRPLLIKADVDRRTVAFLEENRIDMPGVFIQAAPLRNYRLRSLAGHLIGYLGEVTENQLAGLRKKNYRQGDLIGKQGIEYSQEENLRGESGFKQVEVDAFGRELRVVRPFVETPGKSLELTIDHKLQAKAEVVFRNFEGSIVALDPADGAVLAMISNPPINPNVFAGGIRGTEWRKLVQDPLKPLENRAIRGQYPPGSIFKIVMAIAALAEGVVKPEDEIFDPGYFYFGGRFFRGWKAGGHGRINLIQSLAQSCDIYYYTVGSKLGVERIAKYARMFGLGRPTGFDRREKGGLVPSDRWKRRRFGEKWYAGETISVSIGQGFNLITPLQAANLIATAANGGTVWQPYVIRRIIGADGRTVYAHKPVVLSRVQVKKEYFDLVRKGLWEVVNGPRGTARRAKIPGVGVAGKTGTAQVVRLDLTGRKVKPEKLPRKFRDHSWFVAFAPFQNPRIAIAILGEHAGRPGSFFAPMARDLISYYLNLPRELPVAAQNARASGNVLARSDAPPSEASEP